MAPKIEILCLCQFSNFFIKKLWFLYDFLAFASVFELEKSIFFKNDVRLQNWLKIYAFILSNLSKTQLK